MAFKVLLVLITIVASPSMGQGQLVGSSIDSGAATIPKDENGTVQVKRDEEKDLKSRMERMESKSQRQDKEIEVLKTLLEEEKKFSKQLSGRISQLEASTNPSSMENDQLLVRPKRLYRLLPPHIPIEKGNRDGERDQQFYGPATNCDELGLLGYTLNGYYLVKKTTDSTKKSKIGIIFCRFQQPQGQKQSLEKHIGTVDVKTKIVHFYVQRNSGFDMGNAVIPFDIAPVNEGNAFHLPSGTFTAPVPGIYHFDFSALKSRRNTFLSIELEVNGVPVGKAFTQQDARDSENAVSMSASLQLATGDKVRLFNCCGGVLYDDRFHISHFRGWLVEEDLV